MRILVVEDEVIIAKNIKKYLEQNHFTVDVSHAGEEGYHFAKQGKYDCIILDIMLPEMDGITICRNVRKLGIQTPIIMLTAKDSIADKVEGLNEGADDYVVKPFSLHELLARINALLRRHNQAEQLINELSCGDLTCNLDTQTVKRGGKTIKLTATEYKILHYLLLKKTKIVSKSELQEHIRGNTKDIWSDVIRSHMQTLRSKMDK